MFLPELYTHSKNILKFHELTLKMFNKNSKQNMKNYTFLVFIFLHGFFSCLPDEQSRLKQLN